MKANVYANCRTELELLHKYKDDLYALAGISFIGDDCYKRRELRSKTQEQYEERLAEIKKAQA